MVYKWRCKLTARVSDHQLFKGSQREEFTAVEVGFQLFDRCFSFLLLAHCCVNSSLMGLSFCFLQLSGALLLFIFAKTQCWALSSTLLWVLLNMFSEMNRLRVFITVLVFLRWILPSKRGVSLVFCCSPFSLFSYCLNCRIGREVTPEFV